MSIEYFWAIAKLTHTSIILLAESFGTATIVRPDGVVAHADAAGSDGGPEGKLVAIDDALVHVAASATVGVECVAEATSTFVRALLVVALLLAVLPRPIGRTLVNVHAVARLELMEAIAAVLALVRPSRVHTSILHRTRTGGARQRVHLLALVNVVARSVGEHPVALQATTIVAALSVDALLVRATLHQALGALVDVHASVGCKQNNFNKHSEAKHLNHLQAFTSRKPCMQNLKHV